MKKKKLYFKKTISLLLCLLLLFSLAACGKAAQGSASNAAQGKAQAEQSETASEQNETTDVGEDGQGELSEEDGMVQAPDEDAWYYSKDDVALYIWTYGKLPGNFITKSEAKALGWEGGSVEKYAKGMAIGGDKFGNYEEILPKGYKYYECDIDTLGASSRGAKRIIFAEGGEFIWYTEDHYESFEMLYGHE